MALSGQLGVSAELLRAFQAGTTTAVIDATGRLIEVSARLCEVLGRGREDLLERSLGDLFDGASDVRLFHQSAVLDAASGWREVVALQRASGRRIFVELSVEPFPSESGEQHRLLLFNVVSRPRSAELELLRSALEDASQASAQRLQFLFEGVPTMVYSAAADGPLGVRFMSPNVKTVLGHDTRDFVDASFWTAHVHPDDLQATVAHAASLKQTKWQSLQYRFRHRDGTYRWMLDECRLVETPMQSNKIFGYWMDITARKDTELLLRDSQERLAQAQAGAELGGWQLDVASGLILLDEAAAALLGLAADARSVDPDGWRKLVHADDIASFADPLTHHLQGESEIMLVEMRMRHAQSGRWLWVRLRGRVDQRDASGRALRLSGTLVNVTKRKLAEEAALRAQGVVEAATNGMVVVDGRSSELGILYANPAFLRITGYRWEEVVGRNCRFLQGTDHEQPELAELRDAIAARRSCSVTLRNYRKDGALFWNELSVSPVFDPQGHLTHWVGVLNDITTRRRLEEELRQAQKMEAFGQLAGGVAHDFNNLLTVILAGTSLLMRGHTLSAEALAEVHSIAGAAERGADLTRQLLAFSRRSVKSAESLDLGELVSNMAKLLRRVLGEDIQLESRVAPGLPPVLADRGMIDQVIMNLAVNARDAMAHGGRLQIVLDSVFLDDFEARRHPMSRPGRYVCLRVIDSGCGIPSAHLSQIFEPFFTTKAVGKGTGLGLATAYGIVLQHQGWIDVASEVDVGSTFSVYLPAVTEVVRRARKPLAVVRGGRETILIVEDEAPVRRSAKALLEGLGYSVLEADSGDSALWVLNEHAGSIALVFTDMVMPGGTSGRRLAQIVAESHPTIPVIFTSGYSPDVMQGELAIVPGRNFLQKPYRDVELAAAVRSMLDRG